MVKQLVTGGGALSVQNVLGGASSLSTLPPNDGGFNKDLILDIGAVKLGTGGTFTTASGIPIISSAASSTNLTVGTISFPIPRDYDQAVDKLIFRVFADSAGTTDTPVLTGSTNFIGLGSTATAGSSAVSAAITNLPQVYEFNVSGQHFVRDEVVSFTLTSAVHNTDAVQVYAIEAVYASDLVAFLDSTDALNVPLR